MRDTKSDIDNPIGVNLVATIQAVLTAWPDRYFKNYLKDLEVSGAVWKIQDASGDRKKSLDFKVEASEAALGYCNAEKAM